MTEYEAINIIRQSLLHAISKHHEFPSDIIHQTSIMAEECGEAIQAANDVMWADGDIEKFKEEVAQTGAMAIRILINLDTKESEK